MWAAAKNNSGTGNFMIISLSGEIMENANSMETAIYSNINLDVIKEEREKSPVLIRF